MGFIPEHISHLSHTLGQRFLFVFSHGQAAPFKTGCLASGPWPSHLVRIWNGGIFLFSVFFYEIELSLIKFPRGFYKIFRLVQKRPKS
jgi:hypothetical protein